MVNSSSRQLFIFFFLSIFLPSIFATDYVVGDDKGWIKNFDYSTWTQGKMFNVGDNLIFNYPAGMHNVYKVNGTEFGNCTVPSDQTPLETGKDVIPLAEAGKKWYICGKPGHCQANMKLVITVMDMASPSAATKAAVSGHFGFMVMVFAILAAIKILN